MSEEVQEQDDMASVAESAATRGPTRAATFALDTSGTVYVQSPHITDRNSKIARRWSDLDAFTQGYIEALFAMPHPRSATGTPIGEILGATFSDLAPETLAAILKDCARWIEIYPAIDSGRPLNGENMWRYRQAQAVRRPDFPPLTAYLGDDGKIYTRESA